MSEWFREAFQAHYLSLYAHRDEQEAARTVELLTATLKLAPGSRVLDAPCGAGRHARQFRARGYRIFALDLSWDLLRNARRENVPAHPFYLRGDLRAIPLKSNAFDLVVNLFSSFGYLERDEQNLHVLQELARVCRPGGHVVLDFLNDANVRAQLKAESTRTTANGWSVHERRRICGTPPRVEKLATIRSASGEERQLRESVRLFSPQELRKLMAQSGLRIVTEFGDYAGSPFTAASPRILLIGMKP
jgi:SAM-dependent methyltransferase